MNCLGTLACALNGLLLLLDTCLRTLGSFVFVRPPAGVHASVCIVESCLSLGVLVYICLRWRLSPSRYLTYSTPLEQQQSHPQPQDEYDPEGAERPGGRQRALPGGDAGLG